MSSELHVSAHFRIHDGQIDAFKSAARACIESVREKDSETFRYDWYFDPDQTECVVLEHYKDSDAVLAHIANLGEAFGALLAVSEISVSIFGEPSQELLTATEGIETRVYRFYQGA